MMTMRSILVDMVTSTISLFDIAKNMRLQQISDGEYKYVFMLCFSHYSTVERQTCVTRCARSMRYMPLVEDMLKVQPLTKEQWLQFAYNLLKAEESRLDSNNTIACRMLDRAFIEQKVSPDFCLDLPTMGLRNRLLYTFISLREAGRAISVQSHVSDRFHVSPDDDYMRILIVLIEPFICEIVCRMFRNLHETKSCVPYQLLNIIKPTFPGYLFMFKYGHVVVVAFTTVTNADLYVKYMHSFSSDIPDAQPGEVEFLVWQCISIREYKIAKWLLEHMKIDRTQIMLHVTPENNWQLALVGFDTGIPIMMEFVPTLHNASDIYRCIYNNLAAAASVKMLPMLLLQGHRFSSDERRRVFIDGPSKDVRIFALNNAIQTTFSNLIPEWMCASAWMLVCQYVDPDIAVIM